MFSSKDWPIKTAVYLSSVCLPSSKKINQLALYTATEIDFIYISK